MERSTVVGVRLERKHPSGRPNKARRHDRVEPDVCAPVDDRRARRRRGGEKLSQAVLIAVSGLGEEASVPEEAADLDAVHDRAKRRPAYAEEQPIDAVARSSEHPSESKSPYRAGGPAEDGEKASTHGSGTKSKAGRAPSSR